MVFELSGNEVGEVAKGLGGVEDLQQRVQVSPLSHYEKFYK